MALIDELAEHIGQLQLLAHELEHSIPEHLHLHAVRELLPDIIEALALTHQNFIEAQA